MIFVHLWYKGQYSLMVSNRATWISTYALLPWARYLTSLSLGFLLCTMGMIVGPSHGVTMIQRMQNTFGTVPNPLYVLLLKLCDLGSLF